MGNLKRGNIFSGDCVVARDKVGHREEMVDYNKGGVEAVAY